MFCLYKDEASVHYFFPAEMLIIAKTYKKKIEELLSLN